MKRTVYILIIILTMTINIGNVNAKSLKGTIFTNWTGQIAGCDFQPFLPGSIHEFDYSQAGGTADLTYVKTSKGFDFYVFIDHVKNNQWYEACLANMYENGEPYFVHIGYAQASDSGGLITADFSRSCDTFSSQELENIYFNLRSGISCVRIFLAQDNDGTIVSLRDEWGMILSTEVHHGWSSGEDLHPVKKQ